MGRGDRDGKFPGPIPTSAPPMGGPGHATEPVCTSVSSSENEDNSVHPTTVWRTRGWEGRVPGEECCEGRTRTALLLVHSGHAATREWGQRLREAWILSGLCHTPPCKVTW